jgi:UDP:flavonoid glycosyltransferase YjiC (YdhE family)
LLSRLKPDVIVLDNVVMFPAIANAGCPWVRMVSCAETELPDAAVPPYLSGCSASDVEGRERFTEHYLKAVAPAHERFSQFLASNGTPPCPPGQFLVDSPWLNLPLSPTPVRRMNAATSGTATLRLPRRLRAPRSALHRS